MIEREVVLRRGYRGVHMLYDRPYGTLTGGCTLHLALWIYCTHHKLSRTGLRVAEAHLHPSMSRTVAQSELI